MIFSYLPCLLQSISYGQTHYSSASIGSLCVGESVGRDGRLLETPIWQGDVLSFSSERHNECASHPRRNSAHLPPVWKWFIILLDLDP